MQVSANNYYCNRRVVVGFAKNESAYENSYIIVLDGLYIIFLIT